jgi:phosphoribosylformylglycinamidine synthase
MITGAAAGLWSSAHDLADGGLAQALVESSLRRDVGVAVTLPEGVDPFVYLFSESAGRVLVSLPAGSAAQLQELAAGEQVTATRIGVVGSAGPDAVVTVEDQFSLALSEIRDAWQAPIPAALGV